jgi:zinc D-Ala-D-Ala carboxypeptidase
LRKSRPKGHGATDRADDIPVAQRDLYSPAATTPTALRRRRNRLSRWIFLAAGIFVVSLLASSILFFNRGEEPKTTANANSAGSPTDAEDGSTLLGHFRYDEAPASELKSIGNGLRLREAAATKFQEMVAAARSAGVNITVISAFRSVAEQQHLFFDVKAERAQVTTKRAEVSAPPNHSEHHTGYAVDLGDASTPSANLNQSFERTRAYRWLQANAPRYSFELSFPEGNAQGVSYEPWHWRYVGDSSSLKTFSRSLETRKK